ncbi:MAG: 4-carboxymuconolactone decarboxylase [Pseudonocardiales bacterium]|nr:4-carboxymuconolactone decarboxylase [Pseudonocardiales bacterium]
MMSSPRRGRAAVARTVSVHAADAPGARRVRAGPHCRQRRGGRSPDRRRGGRAGNLKVGNTRERLLAVLTVLLPFIGYPRTLNGLAAVNDITR